MPTRGDLLQELLPNPLALWREWLRTQLAADRRARLPLSAESASRAGVTSVSVIPVTGVIVPKRHAFERYGIVTSLEKLANDIAAAVADPETRAIVLDVDSPGGLAIGLHEFAARLRAMRGAKPIIAHADYLAASAAYWIAASTDEVIASPSALVGSVGVYVMHVDVSGALEKSGLDVTLIRAGRDKVLANGTEPLSDEGREYLQHLVDDTYRMFLRDVAEGRGTKPANVQLRYGRGRILTATDALAAGVVDRIQPLEETLSRAGGTLTAATRARELELYGMLH